MAINTLIPEADALRLATEFPKLSDDEKPRAAKMLRDYQAQQQRLGLPEWTSQAKPQTPKQETIFAAFDDPKTVDAVDETGYISAGAKYADGTQDLRRQEVANSLFLSKTYGVAPELARRDYDRYAADYSQKTWGEAVTDPAQFFARAKADVTKERDEFDMNNEAFREATLAAMDGANLPLSLAKWQEQAAKKPGFSAGQSSLYMERYNAIARTLEKHRPAIDSYMEATQRTMQGKAGETDAATMAAFREKLLDMPANEQDLAMRAIAAKALKLGETGEVKGGIGGFFQETGESFGRFVSGDTVAVENALALVPETPGRITTSIAAIETPEQARAFVQEQARQNMAQNYAAVSSSGTAGVPRIAPAGPERLLTSEEAKLVRAAKEREQRGIDLDRKIKRLAEQTDPVTGVVSGTLGPSLGIMAAMLATRGAALPVIAQTYAANNYNNIRLDHPDIAPEKARQIAVASGAAEAALDLWDIKILTKLPTVASLIKNGLKREALTSAARNVGGAYLAENIQEASQDLVLPLLKNAMASDAPSVDFEKDLRAFAQNRGDVALAILPLVLIGGGVATARDYLDFANIKKTNQQLGEAGFIESDRVTILEAMKTGNAEVVDAAIVDASPRRMVEVAAEYQEKAGQKAQADMEFTQAAVAIANRENYTLRRDGEGWSLRTPDGATVRAATAEEAVSLLQQDFSEGELRNAQAVADMADVFLSQKRGGERIEVQPGQSRDIRDDVEEGKLTPEQAREAIVTAGKLAGLSEEESMQQIGAVLGSSTVEENEGVREAVSRIYQGGDAMTVVEETIEGRWKKGLKDGRYTTEQGAGWVRLAEQATGETYLPENHSERELVEAISYIIRADVMGRRKDGSRLAPGVVSRGLRESAMRGNKEAGKLSAFLAAFRELFRRVFSTARKLQKARAEGKLDADFESLLDDLLGIDAQTRYEAETVKVAEDWVDDAKMVYTPLDDETFSISNRADWETPQMAAMRRNFENRQRMDSALKKFERDWNPLFAVILNRALPLEQRKRALAKFYNKPFNADTEFPPESTLAEMLGYTEEEARQMRRSGETFALGRGLGALLGTPPPKKPTETPATSAPLSRDLLDRAIEASKDVPGYYRGYLDLLFTQARRLLADSANVEIRRTDPVTVPQALELIAAGENPTAIANRWSEHRNNVLTGKTTEGSPFVAGLPLPGAKPAALPAAEEDPEKRTRTAYAQLDRTGQGYVRIPDLARAAGLTPEEMRGVLGALDDEGRAFLIPADEPRNIPEEDRPYLVNGPSGKALFVTLPPDGPSYSLARRNLAAFADTKMAAMMKKPELKEAMFRVAADRLSKLRDTIAMGRMSADKQAQMQSLRILDAILSTFPAEVRGRVGGFVKLASLGTDKAREAEIGRRLDKLEIELEKFAKKHFAAKLEKLLEKNRSERSKRGVFEGRTIATVTEQVTYAADFSDLSKEAQDKEIAHLETIIANPDSTREETSNAINKLGVAELFYNLKGKNSRSAEALEQAHDWLNDLVTMGRDTRKILDEERKAYLDDLRKAGVTSILGNPNASQTDAENVMQKINGSTLRKALELVKGFINSVLPTTAQQLEDVFGQGSAVAEAFIPQIYSAANRSNDIKRQVEASRRAMMGRVFKTDSTIKQIIALTKLQQGRKSGVFILDGRKTEDVTVPVEIMERLSDGTMTAKAAGLSEDEVRMVMNQWAETEGQKQSGTIERVTNPGTMKELVMSEMEALNYLLHWNQDEVRARMERHGWTEESMTQLQAFLSPESKSIGEWMSEQYRVAGRALVEPVYRRLYHAPLPFVKNFAPTFYDRAGNDSTLGLDAAQNSSGMMASFTKGRRAHNNNVRRMDAMAVFLSHFEHVSHWVSFVELLRDMKAVLGSTEVQNATIATYGPSAASAMSTRMKAIESQGNDAAWALHDLNGFFGRMNQARAFKGLAYRVSPIVKQTSAFLNPLLADVPASAYAVGLGKLLTGKLDVSTMWNSPTIQRRIEGGFSPEARLAMQASGDGPIAAVAIKLMQNGMMPMQYTDAAWTAAGAAIAFDYYRGLAVKAGEVNPEASALRSVERMIATSAQPADLVNRSLVEASSNPFLKSVWMFASESRKTLAVEYYAAKRLVTGKSTSKALDVQRILTAHFIMGAVTQLMSGLLASTLGSDDDEEREWSAEEWATALIAGPVNGLFVLGDGLNAFIRLALGLKVFRSTSPFGQAIEEAGKAVSNFDDLWGGDSDKAKAELDRLSSSAGTILSGFFGPAAQVPDVILGNPIRQVSKALDED